MTTTETYGCDRHGEDAYQGCALCDLEALRSRLAETEGREQMLLRRCDVLEEERNESDARLADWHRCASRAITNQAVGELSGMAARIQDAQRYRWLVGQNDPIIWHYLGGMDDDQIDEAIDKWIADDAHLSRKEGQT